MSQKDFLNDIFEKEEGKSSIIDLFEFFPKSKIKAILHNNSKIFNDISSEEPKKINLSIVKKLKIDYLRNCKLLDIVSNKPKISITIIPKKYRKIIKNLNLSTKLPKLPRNTLDVRDLKETGIFREYPDIYKQRVSIPKIPFVFLKKYKKLIRASFLKGLQFSFLIFLILGAFILFGLGFKNYMQAEVIDSYQKMYNFKNIRNGTQMKQEAISVKNKLNLLSIAFTPANLFGNNIFYKNDNIILANNIIKGGSQIGEIMVNIGDIYADLENELKIGDSKIGLEKLKGMKITDFLKKENEKIIKVNASLNKAISYYSRIDNLPDKSLNDKFHKVLSSLIKTSAMLEFYIGNKDMLMQALGDTKPVRYLVLNQNNDEIRANGGFPGSVITLELYKGNIIKYDKKDVYYYDWHITPYLETPPEGLNVISPNNGLRDANYSPIFKESADKINFFYEKGGGSSLDGVIAINQTLVKDFLLKYGSVHLPEINMDITSDNFSLVMSTLVENKFQKVTSPKDILFKFTDHLEKKLLEKKDFSGYFDILLDNFQKGEILFSSRNEDVSAFLEKYNFSENWKTETSNWFYPVFTSISGNKSDRYIGRTFNLTVKKNPDCSLENDFNFVSNNFFGDKDIIQMDKVFDDLGITDKNERNRLKGIEGKGENRQFVRVLVPKGTKLNTDDASINLDSSNPKYDFIKFYMNTDISKTSKISFSYTTFPKSCSTATRFYKQPGLVNYKVNIN
ncbi:MAG: DUF4012 domain-containing protein [Candidatus Gracilibacteria bacterium]|nr:DUF4012 domain-containing protein [Candidatus Gracilibacteria bacterium]